jgi:hypothetical protein
MKNSSFCLTGKAGLAFVAILLALIISGCASASGGNGGGTDPSSAVNISTTALSNGQVGTAYNATLSASGGKSPYTWSLTSGNLPAGLSLNSATGLISGTPTSAVTKTPLTFQVSDSSIPALTKTVSLTLTISPATLQISTNSLPNGQVGSAYNATLAASGGTSPYTWSLTSGTLPGGLALNASTGAISGTPTTAVNSLALTFQVSDSSNPALTKSVNLTLTIASTGLQLTTSSLPSGQVGIAYSATLAASGGTAPYTWSLTTGSLPAGLALNSSTGAISGTPTAAVTNTALTFKVTDSSNPVQTKTANLTLTIVAPGLQITTSSLPNGQVGTAYSTTLSATGGTPPYTWSITSGTLPAGLTLNSSTGAITGTPTATIANTALTIKVSDSGNPVQTKTANLTLTIFAADLQITTTSLPAGQVGSAYTTTLSATGGTTPYTWSLTSGTFPAGLTLNSSTGAITGTPTVAVNNSSLTFKVSDSSNPVQSKTASLTLTILPTGLQITTSSLPTGQVGTAYSATLAAVGGTKPYSWSLTSGTLPAGLSLNASTGAISGTPTQSVSATALTFQVSDSSNPVQTKTVDLTLTISLAPVVITTTSLPNGQVGTFYSSTLAASGGKTPYTWSLTSGTLPSGLALNASTGAITGTPTVAVTSAALTFKVSDSSNPVQSKTVNLALTIAPTALQITTSSLPNGQVGTSYTATLAATGGTTPYTWSLTSGTLPTGLSLNTSTGAIAGTPTAAVTSSGLTFKVSDSSSPVQTKTVSLTLTISPVPLVISTTSLPSGQVGTAYSATLAATGGSTPYTWSLISGTLPAGLSLNASTGAITGTPTASATNLALTFEVQDSATPAQTKTVNLTLTISSAGNITVSISPKRAGLTITQTLSLTATTNDAAGVTWSASGTGCSGNPCGTFLPSASLSGVAVTYTAPTVAGIYTITATSATDITISTSITVGVTDLAGVYTWHNNLNRDGTNTQEYALTPALVTTATFGKLFTCTIDAAAYAQPLWVANVAINGGQHNVIYVVTQHNTIYAFDADASPCQTLATRSLLGTNETWLSSADVNTTDITPDIGIVGTPVIDPATNTIYAVTKSKTTSPTNYIQRLHAMRLSDLTEQANSPVQIASGGSGSFALIQNQRPGLALSGSNVYVTWASHGDNGAYHGYIYEFDKTSLAQVSTFNDTPSGTQGGIWMSGAAPAIDTSGNLYCITGNGTFDATSSNYGDSFLKLTSNLSVSDYFTPSDQSSDEGSDQDFGAGGAAILVNSGAVANLAVGGGKDGALYVLNRNNMGHLGDANAFQKLSAGGSIFSTAAFWQNTLYLAPAGGALHARPLNTTTSMFGGSSSQTGTSFGWPGSTPSISSLGATNGIIWAIANTSPAILYAFDPTNLATEFWDSSMASGDQAGTYVKFTVPTVANGKVYVGNSSQITVYGLKPN